VLSLASYLGLLSPILSPKIPRQELQALVFNKDDQMELFEAALFPGGCHCTPLL